MKCPSCGAEIGEGKSCQFCGTQISANMLREQEILNKAGCPKCGSTNVSFNRENQGEVRGKNTKTIVHYTVGVCKDCGYTWRTDDGQSVKKRKTWLWVLGWIFIFPLPLTLILLKKNDMKPALKYGIIAAAWLLFLIIGIAGNSGDKSENSLDTSVSSITTEEESVENNSEEEKALTSSSYTTEKQETEAPKITEATTEEKIPTEYKSALKKAETYSSMMHMSKKAIYEQLTSDYGEQFPADAAQYAIDNLKADYKANALEKAKSYQSTMSMSKAAIYDQLVSEYGEQFTPEEAQYAVDHLD